MSAMEIINYVIGVIGAVATALSLVITLRANKKLKSSAISATRRILSIKDGMLQLSGCLSRKKEIIATKKPDNLVILEMLDGLIELASALEKNTRDSIEDWKDILGKEFEKINKYCNEVNALVLEYSPKLDELQKSVKDLSSKTEKNDTTQKQFDEAQKQLRNELLKLSGEIEKAKEKYPSPFVSSGVTLSEILHPVTLCDYLNPDALRCSLPTGQCALCNNIGILETCTICGKNICSDCRVSASPSQSITSVGNIGGIKYVCRNCSIARGSVNCD